MHKVWTIYIAQLNGLIPRYSNQFRKSKMLRFRLNMWHVTTYTTFYRPEKSQLKKWLRKRSGKKPTQTRNSRLSVGDILARCIEAGQPGLAWSWPLLADGHLEGKLVNGASKPKGSQPSLPPAIWGLLLHLCSAYPIKTFPAGRWIAREWDGWKDCVIPGHVSGEKRGRM